MAWTSVGFDGTITEIQWAGLSSLLGNGYVAAGNGDCKVTAVAGARSVSVAAGSLYGDGVQSTNSGAETVALTTPVNGQWYLIVLRRTWASNTAALVAVAGATTSTTIPTSPPSTYPTINTNVGVLTDQPIAWAWCNSATTDVVVSDLRQFPVRTQESTGNAIINGDFSINQRNFSSVTYDSVYGFDRWKLSASTGVTYTPQTFTTGFAPVAGYEAKNYARITVSGQTVPLSYAGIGQGIEDARTFAGQTVTVSFWAKAASGTPKVGVSALQEFNSVSGNVVTSLGMVTISTVWQRYSVTGTIPSISGKTVGANSALFLGLYGSIGTDAALSSYPQIGIQNNTFDFWGVQVEKGSTATPFKTATGTKQGELAACQRYYYRVDASNSGTNYTRPGVGFCSSTNIVAQIPFPVTMRTAPTAVDSSGANSWSIFQNNTTYAITGAFTLSLPTPYIGSVTGAATGQTSGAVASLEARNNQTAYIGFSAEL